MAGTDSQKQLLSLIRDFATERSDGERRVFNLKKRIEELQSELESANSELENKKRLKEAAEQDIKGYEVELSMTEASIKTLEMRIASVQDEISKIGNDVDSLKSKEATQRDVFIQQMLELKTKIRKFQELAFHSLQEKSCSGIISEDRSTFRNALLIFKVFESISGLKINLAKSSISEQNHTGGEDVEFAGLKEKLSVIVAQTAMEEQEFEKEKNFQNPLHQELADSKRRLELAEAIIKDIKELQDWTKQTSTLEEKCGSINEELQRRCVCPSCHCDNSEVMAELLQEMDYH